MFSDFKDDYLVVGGLVEMTGMMVLVTLRVGGLVDTSGVGLPVLWNGWPVGTLL